MDVADMDVAEALANVEMAAAWDGEEGDDWTEHAERYEAAGRYLWPRLGLGALVTATSRVLDIGCGTGHSTLEAARAAPEGMAVGVDLSSKMLAYARHRAGEEGVANAEFVQADAQVHPFEPAAFDVAISSFGAMFFNDPVAAFTNVGRALAPGGRLALLAWRPLEENGWLMTMRAALALGRTLPAPPLGAPGPFGLAGASRVREILQAAGFTGVKLAPVDEPVYLGRDADDAWTFVRGMGIVRGLTGGLDDRSKQQAIDNLRRAVDEAETPEGVLLPSAAWLITAQAP
jgi:SAM-dependent methyltransferase